jgi:secreted Zn-dependent insulinase-like peptidase
LIEQVTSEIGYEAVLADIEYSIKSFENIGFKLKFSGYNDKLSTFISIFFDIMIRVSKEEFPEWILNLSKERELKIAKNTNLEVDSRATNNRLLYIFDH